MLQRHNGWLGGAALVGLLASTGCALGPNFQRPVVAVPDAFNAQAEADALSVDLGWWEIINDDPVLKALVVEAIDRNKDLQMAVSRMEEAGAVAGINHLGPTVDLAGNATRQRALVAGFGPQTLIGNNFSADVSASWELDLWGRIRRTQESARAQFLASEQDRRAVLLSLIGDVVGGYYQLQALDMKLEIAKRTVEVRQQSLALVQHQMVGGVGNKLETSQAASAVALTRATVPQFEQSVHAQENRLNLLLGRGPGPIPRGQPLRSVPLKTIAPGLPSALLERRPDIASSERKMASANAQIGVAIAAYFPDLTLTPSFGFSGSNLGHLIGSATNVWSLGASVTESIFDAGARSAQVEQARAFYEENVADYRQTVLTGFQQVEDELAALRILEQQAAVEDQTVKTAQEAERLTLNQYKAGTVPYSSVITAQTTALSTEETAINVLQNRLTASVTLIEAVGGGWDASKLPRTDQVEDNWSFLKIVPITTEHPTSSDEEPVKQ